MALQAPNTRPGPARPYGLEERIRELMAQRNVEPVKKPVDELSPFRTDETQRIIRDGEREAPAVPAPRQQTAEDIIAEDSGPRPAPPRPFPKTAIESRADNSEGPRLTGPDGSDTVRDMPEAGPNPPAAIQIPSSLETTQRPRAINVPLPGEQNAGKIRRAMTMLAQQQKEAAEKAKNEADLAAEDAALDASGLIDENGRPIRENIAERHRNTSGADIDGLGSVVFEEARPGTGYKARKPGQDRRIGATEQELDVPMTDRRLPDSAGNRPPMLPGKGQSVERDGGLSPRAPQAGIIDNIPPHLLTSAPPKDQGQFFQWREAMKALAVAAGINVAAFENEEDLVRAGAEIAKQHERMNAPAPGAEADADGVTPPKYERTVTSTGAPVYTPSDAMRKNADDSRRRASARQFVDHHKPDEQTGLAIMEAADKGDWAEVDRLVKGARNYRRASTAQGAMDNNRLRGQTQQMLNPRVAPAMYHESVMKAQTPAALGQTQMAWSPFVGVYGPQLNASGASLVNSDAARKAASDLAKFEADSRLAEAEAGRKPETDGLKNYQSQVNGILVSAPDAVTAINQLRTVNSVAAESGLIPKQDVEYQTHAEVSRHEIRSGRGPNNFATQNGLKMLFDKIYTAGTAIAEGIGATGDRKAEFVRRAQLDLGCDEATANAYLASRGM